MEHELYDIYKNIYESNVLIRERDLNINIETFKTNVNTLESNNILIPEKIVSWINKNINYKYKLNIDINNRNLNISIFSRHPVKLIRQYYSKILLIISFLFKYTKIKCSKNLEIKIYLTPFKKEWDNVSQIDEYNVNTGYSTIGCIYNSKILIYRKEEWFKVLIHELMHNINLDFADIFNEKDKILLKNNFFINSKYDITETYCEFWARQINIFIYSFYQIDEKDNFNKFKILYNKTLIKEVNFAIKQANRLSNFIYLPNYKEKTNVFCYYILTSVLMYYTEDFIIWCKYNNNNLINFTKNSNNIFKFSNFLIEKYYNESYYNAIAKSFTQKIKSMQMSIVSLKN
tara:strand:+ start:1285 stop:2319 length:1035 start_codon:yes stop_codon:yes gene_type:complete